MAQGRARPRRYRPYALRVLAAGWTALAVFAGYQLVAGADAPDDRSVDGTDADAAEVEGAEVVEIDDRGAPSGRTTFRPTPATAPPGDPVVTDDVELGDVVLLESAADLALAPVESESPLLTTTTTTEATTTVVDVESPDAATTEATEVLAEGAEGEAVEEVQRRLNTVQDDRLDVDGRFGPATRAAVEAFQTERGLTPDGAVDAATRAALWAVSDLVTSTSATTTTIPAAPPAVPAATPVPFAGGTCEAAVIGDSLTAGSEAVYTGALNEVGCTAWVDGVGARSLSFGWQCRTERGLHIYGEQLDGRDCDPSGLQLLSQWSDADALGNVVVVSLGTNDAGLYRADRWYTNWSSAMVLAAGRPVVFVAPAARPGSEWAQLTATYTATLEQWCLTQPGCEVADWPGAPEVADPASWADDVHLTPTATAARARVIAATVANVVAAGD